VTASFAGIETYRGRMSALFGECRTAHFAVDLRYELVRSVCDVM
jgi:hypothetical protein